MRKSLLTVVTLVGVGLLLAAPAGAATVYSTGFDAGYTTGGLWGQPAGSSTQWDSK